MAQAKIYWDMQNYTAIEKLFRKSFEFCSDHDTWRLNAGHVLFMQENSKYKKAIDFYEPIVKKQYENVKFLNGNLKVKVLINCISNHLFYFQDIKCISYSFGKSVCSLRDVEFK